MLKKSEVVRRSVVPGAISNPDQVAELVADAADLRRRAGLDPPLRDTVAAGHPRPADRRAARDRHPRRPAPVARRHAQGRRPDRPRRLVRSCARAVDVPRHADRPPRHRGAPRTRRRRPRDASKISPRERWPRRHAQGHRHAGAEAPLGVHGRTKWHLELRPAARPRTARRTSRAGTRCCARACARSSSTKRASKGSRPLVKGTTMHSNDQHPHLRDRLLRRARPPARGPRHPPRPRLRRLERERRRGDGRSRRRAPPGRRARHPLDVASRRTRSRRSASTPARRS